jgi:drug/metabolite transporter (DMT)-like permease
MPDQRSVGRTVFVLSRGARACLLLGLLLLVLGVYTLVTPIDIQSTQGPMVACGSGLRPPSDQFHKNVCGRLAHRQQVQAGFLAGGALVVAAGGMLVFGSSRREERAATATEDGESPLYGD